MKLVSWNVNGLRACIQKGFLDQFNALDADFFCLQETKLSEGQLELNLPGYEQYWCYAEKKGYSGTAIFTKHTPISVHYGLDVADLDNEGRLITLEYPEFYLLTCYTPNAQRELARIDHRMKWDEAFRAYIQKLDGQKPVILCGDLNVAHQEIDLKNPKSNRGSAGFSDEERQSFQKTLDMGFTDTFRYLHPDARDRYTWWSYMFKAREKNAGWRIDYFLVSDRVRQDVYRADIHSDIFGSDHCPVSIQMDLVCNGGIWSPASSGKASVPGEDHTPSAPKASAVSAKAIIPFIAVFLLLLAVSVSFFRLPDANDHDYVVETLLYTVNVCTSQPTPPVIGSADKLFYNDLCYFTDQPVNPADLSEANVWLQIILTPAGKKIVDESWQVLASPLSFTASSSGQSQSAYRSIVRYYSDEDRTDHCGWFVFLSLSAKDHVSIFVGNGQHYQTSSVDVVPYINLTTLENPMDTLVLTTPPAVEFDDLMTSQKENWTDRVSISIDGKTLYSPADDSTVPMSAGRYWVYVKPSHTLSQFIPMENMSLTVKNIYFGYDIPTISTPDAYQSAPTVYFQNIRPLYSDNGLAQQCGWLIYGDDPHIELLELHLACNNTGKNTVLQHQVAPYATNKYEFMTSNELVEAIVNDPELCGSILSSLSDKTPEVPVVQALLSHSDCIHALMNYTTAPEAHRTVPFLLLGTDSFREKMTPQEEVSFLLCTYPSSPFDISKNYILTEMREFDLAHVSTRYLVTSMLYNTEPHDALLQSCSSEKTRQEIYLFLREQVIYLKHLEKREDALEIIGQYATEASYGKSILPWLVDLWPYIQTLSTESLKTAAAS